jgi:hypothetical protein
MNRSFMLFVVAGLSTVLALWGCGNKTTSTTPKKKVPVTKNAAKKKATKAPLSGKKKAVAAKAGATLSPAVDKVIKTALAAVKKGDGKSFLALAGTFEAWKKACPAEVTKMGGDVAARKAHVKTAKAVVGALSGRCAALELHKAKRISITHGKAKAAKDCPGWFYRRVTAHYVKDKSYIQVVLRGAGTKEGATQIREAPRCILKKGPAPLPWAEAKVKALPAAKAWASTVCKCKDATCVKTAMARMNTVTNLTAPHRDRFNSESALHGAIMKVVQQAGKCAAKASAAPKPAPK